MPQFSVIPERARILERIPDYSVTAAPLGKTATIQFHGVTVAESDEALLVKETRHDDVVYLPRSALQLEHFTASDHTTYCPFKGHANYWHLSVGEQIAENVVWSYETPYPEVSELKDYVSFYTDRTRLVLS
ncbi:MAG: DUF427 domain-containing protein [Pseudomonadales bacterium]